MFGFEVLESDIDIGGKSGTQKYETTVTCEAEYDHLCDASKKTLFTRAVLVFLKRKLNGMS